MDANPLVMALIAMGLLAGGTTASQHRPQTETTVSTTSTAPIRANVGQPSLPDFSGIAQRYGPAVVNINTQGMVKKELSELDPDGQLSQLFGGVAVPPLEVPVRGLGSGFIISADGLVLTNAHVVQNASEVTVKLTDRREFRAKVLGSDSFSDVAVLKIPATNLPTVRLGKPADLRPGQWVVAIGSPFGFENSVTAGIVSAKRRALPGDGYVPFIQTDAPVNPGSSGGPLFNMAGEVIGINAQILSANGGYQGLSFAIPIDVAARVEQQIVSTGHATHARLGITIQEVSQPLADSFGLKKPQGALVSSVAPGSAAAHAELQPGDVILKANGRPIVESGDLPELVDKGSPGDRMTLDIWRKGAPQALSIALGQVTAAGTAEPPTAASEVTNRLGLLVRPLNPQERGEAQVTSGVVVERAAGAAAVAGIQPGDIVLAVNGISVKSPQALGVLARRSKGTMALLVQRGDARMFVPINIG